MTSFVLVNGSCTIRGGLNKDSIMQRLPSRFRLTATDHCGPAAYRSAPRALLSGAIRLCFFVSVLILPTPGVADTLAGTVVGKDGQPRPYVRIDIIGPQKVVIVADENGKFAVDVPQGRYKVRVTDDRRRMDFAASSPVQGKQFKLNW